MNIHEAVKQALENNGRIIRSSVEKVGADAYGIITPTHTRIPCSFSVKKDSKEVKRGDWSPTADDLMADDWIVIKE